ncbi:MAG: hypothetical protein ACR2NP_17510 [Pirellulaceae bacterium]
MSMNEQACCRWPGRCTAVLIATWLVLNPAPVAAQDELNIVRELQFSGSVESFVGDRLTLIDVDGKRQTLRVQEIAGQPIALTGGDIALERLAEIEVNVAVSSAVLLNGMTVEIVGEVGAAGRTGGISEIRLLPIGTTATGIQAETVPDGRELVETTTVGRIKSVNERRMVIAVPRHDMAPREQLTFMLEGEDSVTYQTPSMALVSRGDVVKRVAGAELSTGDIVTRRIEIDVVGTQDNLRLTADELLQLQYVDVANTPIARREVRSRHFILDTDISEQRAAILLDKLEIMHELVTAYFGRQPPAGQLIRCVVVDRPAEWDMSAFHERAQAKIAQGEGVTYYRRLGRQQDLVVYAASNDDVVQHEAVHAFCFLTYGGNGPLWYAEGMAEIGQYWKVDDFSVNATPAVIGYLTSRQPQPLMNIVKATTIEGEYWKAYAWRWALCHLLTNNPNYSREFKRLGVAMMQERNGASFENTFRDVAREITFEYEQFMQHMDRGLRVDLCAWQWNVKPRVPGGARPLRCKVDAAHGWQATGMLLDPGARYLVEAEGQWRMSETAEPVDANGNEQGEGRLIGVIMKDYQLSEEFELGPSLEFTPPGEGHLYVRCQEPLSQIADNQGELTLNVRRVRE